MKAHYAASVTYDNDRGEWEDSLIMAFNYNDLIKDIKALMKRKRHSEVFFAAFIDNNGREHDITQKAKEETG
ncbi:MAG TPA: hypothetical protein DG048_11205 [Pseudoalteromonas sp.]|nr:hypothetical protein [Pseudoalteromonas sp.]|tara:strand:- start:992 stop:1207 length:216 start_codon:yes stop_codon:yes gene_type:complete